MENVGPNKGHNRQVKSKKLKSPKSLRGNTMDSFQDGGQQNMSNEQGEYFNQMEGPNMNVDMNNYPPSSREQMMGMDSYGRMNPMMHPGQMQGYPYNRENFNPGDQHGGMTGSSEINQNTFQTQYMQSGMKTGHPGNVKPNMIPMRPQMGPGGQGMSQSYPHGQRPVISGQSISQQSGPTPTLNQLLQTPNAPGRMQGNNYGEFHQKGGPDVPSQTTPYNMQQGWTGNRQPSSFPPGPGTPYRGQGGPEGAQQRSSFSPNYSMIPNQYAPGQFSPNSRFGMTGTPNRQNASFNNQMGPQYGHQQPSSDQYGYGSTPSQQYLPPSSQSYMPHTPSRQHTPSGPTPPPSSRISPAPSDSSNSQPPALSPTPSRQQTSQTPPSSGLQQQQPTSQQPSPAGSNSSWSGTNNSSTNKRNGDDSEPSGDIQSEESGADGLQHPSLSALRPTPSPVGSSGSRSNTPASLPGNAVGSPMQPRQSSQQVDGQNTHITQSPMATQGYSQQMMPPPMGPNHMNYGPGGKMPSNNMSGPMGNYPAYNNQFQQSGFQNRSSSMGMSPNSGMQNYSQNMYNGPSQPQQMGGNSNMYGGNMQMNRNLNNSNFMYGQGNNMNSQYGNFNHISSSGQQVPPVTGGGGPTPTSAMNSMGQMPGGQHPQGVQNAAPPVKGAHAAAQAALAAAAAASGRPQPIRSNMTSPQRMFSPQSMNHVYGQQMNNSIPNSTSPLPKSQSPVPSSTFGPPHNVNSMPNNSDMDSMNDSSRLSQPNMSNSSHIPTSSESLPTSINVQSSEKSSMQQDSNSCSSTLSNTSMPSGENNVELSNSAINSGISIPDSNSDTNMSEPTLENGPRSSTPEQGCVTSSTNSEVKKQPISELAGLIADDGDSNKNRMMSRPSEQSGFPPSPKNEQPITTTATTNNTETEFMVTQSITSPVTSISQPGQHMMEGQHNHIPPPNCAPMPHMMPQMESQQPPQAPPEKKKKKSGYGDIQKMYEMGNEPDRRFFLDQLFMFLDEKNTPLTSTPSISKQPLDLYKLYVNVRDRGGMQEVTKSKKWKEICGMINIGSSASAAFTLKKNYIKYLFAYECQFDRNGMDPQPILAQIEAQLQHKREQKNRGRAPSPANSQGSQDAFRPPSTPNNSNQAMDGFPHMNPNYMNSDPQMGPMGGMMPPNSMMNNMMPNTMGMGSGMPHGPMHNMQGGMMGGNMPQGGMMGNKSYPMMPNSSHGPGMMGNNMMPQNSMNNMMQQQNMGMQNNPNMMQPMNQMPNNPMASGGMPSNPMATGNMSNNPMATSNMSNNPMASGNMPTNPMVSGGMPNNQMGPGSMPNNPNMMAQGSMSSGPITNQNMMSGGAISNNPNMMPQGSMSNTPNMMAQGQLPNNQMMSAPNTANMVSKVPKSDSVSCQDPFADEPSFARQQRASNSPMPNFSGMPSQQASAQPQQSGMPSHQSSMPPNSSSFSFNRPNMPPQQNFPNVSQPNTSFAETSTPPTSVPSDTFNNESVKPTPDSANSSTPPVEPCVSSSSSSSYSATSTANAMPQMSTAGRQFPFGDQFSQPDRFESTSSPLVSTATQQGPPVQQSPMQSQVSSSQSMDPMFSQRFSNQQPQLSSSQSMDPGATQRYMGQQSQTSTSQNMEPMYSQRFSGNQQAQTQSSSFSMDPMYSNRYSNQQYQQQGGQYGDQQPPSGPQQPGYSSGYGGKPMMGQDFQSFPSQQGPYQGPRPQMSQEMAGQQQMYGTPNKRFPNTFEQGGYYPERPGSMYCQGDGMMYSDNQNFDGRNNSQWSPMGPRYPGQHMNTNYPGGMPAHMSSPYQRGHMRMSPTRDKQHMSPQRMQKSVSMPPNSHFPPKKEMIFPPESVEAVGPILAKRKRLTKTDVGQIEAWRIMMALKSGLLAESTWAIDTLNILLFDDSTISYFNLSHLPGLLEVLLEHFRRCLIEMFGETFEEGERGMCDQYNESFDSINSDKDREDNLHESGAKVKVDGVFTDYTNVTRKGKTVKMEETSDLGPSDPKRWDVYSGYSCKFGHWQLGGGDTSLHIVPLFGSKDEKEKSKRLFLRKPMELKEEFIDSENCDENENELIENKDNIKMELKSEPDTCSNESEKSDLKTEQNVNNSEVDKVLVKKEPVDISPCSKMKDDMVNDQVEEGRSNGCEGENYSNEKENGENIKEEEVEESQNEQKIKEETLCTVSNNTSPKPNVVSDSTSRLSSNKRKVQELEDESYQKDEHPLNTASYSQDELGRKCVCLSNIFRSLSCVTGNTTEISRHAGLMFTLGKILTLHHYHLPRNTTRRKFDRDDNELEELTDSHLIQSEEEWWWQYLTLIRENILVVFANIASHLELAIYPEEICLPILDGLLHWAVCPSACATDPFPSSTSSVLSPQRLVFEAMSKLCIHESNVDLLLATPPYSRIVTLLGNLIKALANKSEPVIMEFAIVLLAELVQGDSSAARAIAMQHPSVSLLLDFLEMAEHKAMQVANMHGINMLRDNPEMMGTSLDMLRRAATILLHMAMVPDNRPVFSHHQQRLLSLVMSQILDQYVAQILSDVLFHCFRDDDLTLS